MRALIIYNKYSGINGNKEIDYLKKKLYIKYNEVEVYESKNDIKDYVFCNSSKYDLLIVIGGDGTINQAVNGLMLIKNKPTLCYIPMGTCNDFGRSQDLKKTLDKIVEGIFVANTKYISVNKVNTDYYLYGLALGNMTNVSYDINPKLKRMFGRIGYYLNVCKYIFKDESFHLDLNVDNNNFSDECFCLMVLNTRFLASKKIKFKNDYVNNDKFKVVIIKKKNKFINLLNLIMFFIFGEKYYHNMIYYDGKYVSIKTDKPMKCNIDGECLPIINNLYINRLKDVIKLIDYK